MRLFAVCIALAPLVGLIAAQEPAAPTVLSAKRTLKYDHAGMVTEPKDKSRQVLTVVQLGGISLEEFVKQQAKKGASLTCEKEDCRLAVTTSGGKKQVLILLVFTTPKEAQKCTLSMGDYSALDVAAEAEVRDSISPADYLK
jgi:hypothetical protein